MSNYSFSLEIKKQVIADLKKSRIEQKKREMTNLIIALVIMAAGIVLLFKSPYHSLVLSPSDQNPIFQASDLIEPKLKDSEKAPELFEVMHKNYAREQILLNGAALVYKIFVVVITFFIVRIFIGFQVHNTRKRNHYYTLINALELYDNRGDFEKLVNLMKSGEFESIKEYPDGRVLSILDKLKSQKQIP